MSRRRWIVLTVVTVVAAWAGLAGWHLVRAASDLRSAREAVDDAMVHLQNTDLDRAHDALGQGRDMAAGAAMSLGRPWVVPLRLVPFVGGDLTTATVLAEAVRDVTATASDLFDVMSAMAGASTQPGQVPLASVRALSPSLTAFAESLQYHVDRVGARGCQVRFAQVRDACARYLEVTAAAAGPAAAAADLAVLAPDLLGGDGPRRYLVFAASYSELRGSGGVLGSWALMEADDGRLEVGPFHETMDLVLPAAGVEAPSATFEARYARYAALRDWRNVNMSPDLPEVGRAMLRMWEVSEVAAASGVAPAPGAAGASTTIDGILVISPLAIEGMIELHGPLVVPGVTTLTRANVRRFIGLEAYSAFETEEERKRVLGAVASAGFERMLDLVEGDDVLAAASLLQRLVRDGDLRIWSPDPTMQAALAGVGAVGALPEDTGLVTSLVLNNLSGGKVDYFLGRDIEQVIWLDDDGAAVSDVRVGLRNDAPTEGLPAYVLGPATPHTGAGDNLLLVSLYCGRTCTLQEPPDGVRDGGQEAGLQVWDVTMRVPAGAAREVAYRTRIEDAWHWDGSALVVPIRHVVQPMLHPGEVVVRVRVPEGYVAAPAEGIRIDNGDVVIEGTGSRDLVLDVRLEPLPAES